MVADQSQVSDGIYMTVEQYLTLDEATDGKYERLNGMVTMLRPPSSLDGADEAILDMAGGRGAPAALLLPLGGPPGHPTAEAPPLVDSTAMRGGLPRRQYLSPHPAVAADARNRSPTTR